MTPPRSVEARRRETAAEKVSYAIGRLEDAHAMAASWTAKFEERVRAASRLGVPMDGIIAMLPEELNNFEIGCIIRRVYAELYTVEGADTVMWCLAHRRKVTWIPWPGWWIHDDNLRNIGGANDPRGCVPMLDATAPITVILKENP
jgi:hypothetical protein